MAVGLGESSDAERQFIMQRSRRTAVYAVVTGLLTAGTLTATMSAAHANLAGFCNGSGAKATCSETEQMTAPTSVTIAATATVNGEATVTWSATCSNGTTTATASGGSTSESPVSDSVVLPYPAPTTCTVSTTVTLPTSDDTNALNVAMTYTTASSASPSPSASPTSGNRNYFKGFDGKCLDDAGNSSANRSKVQIWTCSGDLAQGFSYQHGELIHNGKCVNDQRSGGNGSKVILYSCNGAANEIWTHLANGELVLKANSGKYCLNDPAYSTRNGTQLVVWTCTDSTNERWYQP
jgi:beta-glucosidase